jgi:hypothetical protein
MRVKTLDDHATSQEQQEQQLPSQPVARLVGHDVNTPITVVQYTCKYVSR